jgi:phosphotransferase system HPr (HPr) family protein
MNEQVAIQTVKIVNPQGLHARPANMFVRCASEFQSAIEVIKDGERVDGKSILGVLTLVAEQGTQLAIEARGPDADDAIKALAELVSAGFEEMET